MDLIYHFLFGQSQRSGIIMCYVSSMKYRINLTCFALRSLRTFNILYASLNFFTHLYNFSLRTFNILYASLHIVLYEPLTSFTLIDL